MIKICITGPESSGKTTLATQLAEHFEAQLISEFAREYLEEHGPEYQESDLLTIAQVQFERESRAKGNMIICDTGLEVIQIWSEWKYGDCHSWIKEKVLRADYDLYLLCRPDLPWEADPLRESERDLNELFRRYGAVISKSSIPSRIVSGIGPIRLETAVDFVNERIKKDRR